MNTPVLPGAYGEKGNNMPNRYTYITTDHLDAIYGSNPDRLICYDISSPTWKHCHPQFLTRSLVEKKLSEGYKLRLQ